MKKLIFLSLLVCFSYSLNAQHEMKYGSNNKDPEWVQLLYADQTDVGVVINAYEQYYKTNKFQKNKHTQYYKRWLRALSRQNGPVSNDRNQRLVYEQNVNDYISRSEVLRQQKSSSSEWECIGPWDFDITAASRSYAPGAAHIYTVEQAKSDSLILYAGAATAGVWKSIDGGENWTLLTRDMIINNVFALEIDHSNPDIVYFEGEGYIYKTVDGGLSWHIIGDDTFQSLVHNARDIVMDPQSSNVLYLTSDNGFYRSSDAGANWTQVMSGKFQEIEIHPTNDSIIYTIKQLDNKTEFYKSLDGGLTFSLKINGWPNPGLDGEQKRTEIAVTPAEPEYVFALATGSDNGGSGLYGVYKSIDGGETWSFTCCGNQAAGVPDADTNINMMGWADNGSDDGGQYYYDLAFAVSPVDADKVHVGGVNHWVSTDGGASFTCPAKWSHPGKVNYVHADIHDIRYYGDELWIACDGGIFFSDDGGANINKKMFGIEGSDFWGFGASPQSDVMLGGAYHNGTLLKDNDTYINDWICTGGGDGVKGFVNFGNDRIAYDDWGGRMLSGDREVPIEPFRFDSLPNSSYIIGQSSRLAFDPRNYNTIYLGRGTNLLKTENNGQTFEIVHGFDHKVMAVEVAWTNPDILYLATYEGWWDAKKVWRSENAGATWSEITPSNALLDGSTWVPYDLAVSSTDPNTLWLARTSQYSYYPNLNGKQVFKSTDGGTTWTNLTTPDLDGEHISNIVHQKGTDGGVYVGTRRAVYYRNNSMDHWALFNNSLPLSTMSTKLVPYYKEGKIRNATNRSVYECDFYEPSVPQAQIAADKYRTSCSDTIVRFVDHSTLSKNNASWQWTFPGGIPESSTEQNPVVIYNTPGSFDVTLTVTDIQGTSTQSYTGFITYEDFTEPLDMIEDFEAGVDAHWRLFNADNSYSWSTINVDNGADCIPTTCAFVSHYSINEVNDEAELITPYIDLTEVESATLHFDYAYARYSDAYQDGFRVGVSMDCANTWMPLFEAFGDSLSTVGDQGEWWQPSTCSDWAVDNTLDLSAFAGQKIMIRFVAINGYGNNFFLDNIKVTSAVTATKELEDKVYFKVYPNPSDGRFTISHNMKDAVLKVFSSDGKLVFRRELISGVESIDAKLAPGIYHVNISDGQLIQNKKLVIGEF